MCIGAVHIIMPCFNPCVLVSRIVVKQSADSWQDFSKLGSVWSNMIIMICNTPRTTARDNLSTGTLFVLPIDRCHEVEGFASHTVSKVNCAFTGIPHISFVLEAIPVVCFQIDICAILKDNLPSSLNTGKLFVEVFNCNKHFVPALSPCHRLSSCYLPTRS